MIRHRLSPEAVAALEKIMDAVDGLDAYDAMHIAHNLLCLALANLPERSRDSIVDGLETSVPRTVSEYREAGKPPQRGRLQ
jgi:hypothetical protein